MLGKVRFSIAFLLLLAAARLQAADKFWVGGAGDRAEVKSFTPGTVEIGDIFTITINGKPVSYTAAAATVGDVCTGLAAACTAEDAEEFNEVTWSDQTTFVRGTASSSGVPWTATTSTTDGGGANTQTLVAATTTAATGPECLDSPNNWSGGAVPAGGDDIYIVGGSWDIRYNLAAFTGTTFASVNVYDFTGTIGLPVERSGSGYKEYRDRALKCGMTVLNVGIPDGSGLNSGLLRFDGEAVQSTVNIYGSSSPSEAHGGAIQWKGTHASNVVNVYRGNMKFAPIKGDTATIATLNVFHIDSDADVFPLVTGPGVTLGTLNVFSGVVGIRSNPTTTNIYGGTLYCLPGNTGLGTLTVKGGSIRGAR